MKSKLSLLLCALLGGVVISAFADKSLKNSCDDCTTTYSECLAKPEADTQQCLRDLNSCSSTYDCSAYSECKTKCYVSHGCPPPADQTCRKEQENCLAECSSSQAQ